MNMNTGFTKLCKGLAVVLIGGHIVVQMPSAVSHLALIPAKYSFFFFFSFLLLLILHICDYFVYLISVGFMVIVLWLCNGGSLEFYLSCCDMIWACLVGLIFLGVPIRMWVNCIRIRWMIMETSFSEELEWLYKFKIDCWCIKILLHCGWFWAIFGVIGRCSGFRTG